MIESNDIATLANYDNYVMVTFHDVKELDLYNIRYLSDLFTKNNSAIKKDWIVDMSIIRYVDSSSIGVLLKQGRYLANDTRKLILISVQSSITRLFQAVGFDKFITVHTDRSIY